MKRRSILIESESLDLLRAIKAATGLSESEQVRRAIRWWLERREWPLRSETATPSAEPARQKVLRKS